MPVIGHDGVWQGSPSTHLARIKALHVQLWKAKSQGMGWQVFPNPGNDKALNNQGFVV
ncbi:hypothetical protein EMIT0P74_120078 [Pseudomonas sp. IT-P74]